MSHSATVTSKLEGRNGSRFPGMVLLIILALIGLVDSTYLSINHFNGAYVSCSATGGCEEVLGSEYSALGGVPIAGLGAIYYTSVIALTVAAATWQSRWYRFLPLLTLIGLAVSIYLISLQVFILQAFCTYCLVSAAVCFALFVVTLFMNVRIRAPARKL